jgi:hypothetical protein
MITSLNACDTIKKVILFIAKGLIPKSPFTGAQGIFRAFLGY